MRSRTTEVSMLSGTRSSKHSLLAYVYKLCWFIVDQTRADRQGYILAHQQQAGEAFAERTQKVVSSFGPRPADLRVGRAGGTYLGTLTTCRRFVTRCTTYTNDLSSQMQVIKEHLQAQVLAFTPRRLVMAWLRGQNKMPQTTSTKS